MKLAWLCLAVACAGCGQWNAPSAAPADDATAAVAEAWDCQTAERPAAAEPAAAVNLLGPGERAPAATPKDVNGSAFSRASARLPSGDAADLGARETHQVDDEHRQRQQQYLQQAAALGPDLTEAERAAQREQWKSALLGEGALAR